jgi:polysaccharide export outer membrane protein
MSCSGYKQNIMFKVNDVNAITKMVQSAETNYVIQKNDFLKVEVYTNKGERLIDPNQESFKQAGASNVQSAEPSTLYLLDLNGLVKLPLLNEVKLEGLTIRQAEDILQKEYAKFYEEPFVVVKFANKRVVVLGTAIGQVIPLANENTKLTEVLAAAKAITNESKAHNIRILRQEKVYVADLSTIEGYLKNDLIMQPGDIVYVEPVRRPVSEGIREYGPVLSIITSIGTLIIVIVQVSKP